MVVVFVVLIWCKSRYFELVFFMSYSFVFGISDFGFLNVVFGYIIRKLGLGVRSLGF